MSSVPSERVSFKAWSRVWVPRYASSQAVRQSASPQARLLDASSRREDPFLTIQTGMLLLGRPSSQGSDQMVHLLELGSSRRALHVWYVVANCCRQKMGPYCVVLYRAAIATSGGVKDWQMTSMGMWDGAMCHSSSCADRKPWDSCAVLWLLRHS